MSLYLFCFLNYRFLKSPANIVLLSLVISDLLAGSIVLPYHLHKVSYGSETLAHQAFLLFSMTVGMFGTVLVTADRFLAIILPLRYTLLVTTLKARFVVIISSFHLRIQRCFISQSIVRLKD